MINELIEKLKKCDDLHDRCDYLIEHDEITYLLDYITNLQQENERLKENNMSYQEEMTRTWKIADDYKSRIEKAVEYINNNLLYSEDFDYDEEDNLVWQGARCDTESEDLLNILNGRSDE